MLRLFFTYVKQILGAPTIIIQAFNEKINRDVKTWECKKFILAFSFDSESFVLQSGRVKT